MKVKSFEEFTKKNKFVQSNQKFNVTLLTMDNEIIKETSAEGITNIEELADMLFPSEVKSMLPGMKLDIDYNSYQLYVKPQEGKNKDVNVFITMIDYDPKTKNINTTDRLTFVKSRHELEQISKEYSRQLSKAK